MKFLIARVLMMISIFLSANTVDAETADTMWQLYIDEGPTNANIPDFSYAGFFAKDSVINTPPTKIFNVLDFNAVPDDGIDDSQAIQSAINAASENGGGIIFLPRGRYTINGGEIENVLRITSSNIIIRGEINNGDNVSILFLQNASNSDALSLIGQHDEDLRSISAISIQGMNNNTVLAHFADADFTRGTTLIEVDDTSKFRPHQTILIQLSEPEDSGDMLDQQDSIVSLLTAPFEFTGRETSTLERYGKRIEYITKIKKIVDNTHIELYQPLRFEHLRQHSPTILDYDGLTNIGIENIHFESAWPGQYIHHAPYPADAVGEDIIRSEREQDYGWVALWGTWVSDSWISNVSINNFTQNLILSNSAFIDVELLTLDGDGGHAGITYSSAYNILTKNINIVGDFVHPLSIRAWTSGCVFQNVSIATTDYNPIDRTGPFIDFHGLYPYENLFENITGFYVHSGGDLTTLPHSGVRNTFWNITTPDNIERFDYAKGEFFNTTATQVNKMYEYYPSSIVVGVYNSNGEEVSINRNPRDRVEPFMQIYNLNYNNNPVESLFNAQVALRQTHSPLLPEPPEIIVE